MFDKLTIAGIDSETIDMIKLVFSSISLHIGKEVVHFNSGTPQGSLISPILFDLYINDLLIDLEKDSKILCVKAFADDIMTITFGPENTKYVIRKFRKWAGLFNMEINDKKSQIVQILKSKSKFHKSALTSLENLKCVSTYKYLGVHFDQTLKFEGMFEKLKSKFQHFE